MTVTITSRSGFDWNQSNLGQFTRSTLALAMVLGAILTAAPASAGSELGRTESGIEVPFHMEQTLQAIAAGPGRCDPLPTITLVGEGVGTHLGAFTEEETDCFNPTTLTFEDVVATITAADGSQLFANGEGQLIPTQTPGLFEIDGSVIFTGGTGRFEGASGFASGSGTFNLLTGQGTNILHGTLILNA